MNAESVRENIEKHWKDGIFSTAQIQEYQKQGEIEKILATVPIVDAWRAAMRGAENGKYTFKVPKFQPRNPDNQPDEFEARVLKKIKRENLDEYHEIDHEINAVRFFRPIRLSQQCMLCHGDPATSQELWGNSQGLDATGEKMEGWNVGEIHGAFEVVQSLDLVDQKLASNMRVAIGLVSVGLLAMGGIVWFSICKMTHPLTKAVDFARTISDGDLTERLEQKHEDEIGTLVKALNDMADNLRGAVKKVSESSVNLSASAAHLTTVSTEMASGSDEMSSQSNVVAAAGEELSSNINSIAAGAQEMSTTVHPVSAAIEQMSASLNEVANEVKELAKQSLIATDQISRQIADIQSNTSEAVEAMKQIGGVIEEVDSISTTVSAAVEEQSATTSEIAQNVGGASNATNEIAQNVQECAQGANDVANTIQQMSVAAQQTAQGASQTNNSAQELASLADGLNDVVKRFKV